MAVFWVLLGGKVKKIKKEGRKKERQMWKKKGKYRQRMRECIKIKMNNGRMKER